MINRYSGWAVPRTRQVGCCILRLPPAETTRTNTGGAHFLCSGRVADLYEGRGLYRRPDAARSMIDRERRGRVGIGKL